MAQNPATVMVTGAAGNLGRAVAQRFARDGANLVLVGSTRDSLARAYGDDDPRRLLVGVDLRDADATTQAVTRAVGRFTRIDVLVNVAGGFSMGEPVHGTTDDALSAMFDVNVRTMMHATRAVVPHMLAQRDGKVVNIGALSALKGGANMGAYAAAKSAVIRLTESMAAELREHSVNVNCVLPSILDTPENRAAMPAANPSRWVSLDELASVIAFLASDAARAIHGAAIPVSGLS